MSFSLKGLITLDSSGFTSGVKSASSELDGMSKKAKEAHSAANEFSSGIGAASSNLGSMSGKSREAESSVSKMTSTITGSGGKANQTMASMTDVVGGLTNKLLGVAAGAAAFVGLTTSVKDAFDVFVTFEKKMSNVKALTGATAEETNALTMKAREMGKLLPASASDAADAEGKLASAGFSTNEIMASLYGTLTLAQSANVDMATAADISASTLRGFGLEADKASHVADVLALTASKTNAEIVDTGEAMKYVAPVAKSAGTSLEETAAMIGLLANAGIKGSQAGTTLRAAFVRFQKPAKSARDAMAEIGLAAYDSSGKMKPMSDILGELKDKTAGLTDEQRDNIVASIFGTEALSGMKVLMDQGKPAIDALTESFKNADGASEEMAKTQTDNVYGSLEDMKGAFEDAQIEIMGHFAPGIRAALGGVSNSIPFIVNNIEWAAGALGEAFAPVGESIMTHFAPAIDTVKATFETFTQGVDISGLEGLGSAIIDLFSNLAMMAGVLWNDMIYPIYTIVTPAFTTLFNTVVSLLTDVVNFFSGAAQMIAGIASGDWATAWEGVKQVVESVVNFVEDLLGGVVRTLNSLASGVKSFGSAAISKAASTFGLGGHANGTSYFQGGPTAINERGGELQVLPSGTSILPADQTRQLLASNFAAGNGGNNVTIHVDARGMDADELVTQLQVRLANM